MLIMRRSGLRAALPVGDVTAVLTLAMIGMMAGPAAAAVTLTRGESVQRISADSSISTSGNYPYGAGSSSDLDAKGKRDKLPFRTGSIVLLVSPGLKRACDVASDPAPYGPYGPGGDKPYSPGGDDGGWWALQRLMSSAVSDGTLGRKGGSTGSPYDYGGGDDGPAFVWCNATIPDSPPQPYPSGGGGVLTWMGALAAAVVDAAATALGAEDAVRPDNGDASLNSQWDLDGFVLMGTDFQTADVYSGGRVYLKNQISRKFCRLAGSEDDLEADAGSLLTRRGGRGSSSHDDDEDLLTSAAALVCDQMTSSERTEFVVELVPEKEGRMVAQQDEQNEQDEQDEQEEEGRHGRRRRHAREAGGVADDAALPGGDGDWPSGGGGDWLDGRSSGKDERPDGADPDGGDEHWPGPGGKEGKKGKISVLVRLRAPQNDLRYCAPDRRIRGSPIICDLHHPDTSRRRITTFRLVDATPSSYPAGPTYSDGSDLTQSLEYGIKE